MADRRERTLSPARSRRKERTKETSHSVAGVFRDVRIRHMCLHLFLLCHGPVCLTFWMPTLVKATGVTGNRQYRLISAISPSCARLSP